MKVRTYVLQTHIGYYPLHVSIMNSHFLDRAAVIVILIDKALRCTEQSIKHYSIEPKLSNNISMLIEKNKKNK